MYFDGRPNVKLVKASATDVRQFFGLMTGLMGNKIDLGERKITVIPTPDHQEETISIYDHQTKWLMTGDTLYPSYIYVEDWQAYRKVLIDWQLF
ncbi:MAG: hydroxyacylglutathione hydrolase [Psychroserpens sp.]|jgi:glyoxylase-like metal-dependent hydrolase (beta-lactamase superfamily II)